MEFRKPTIFKLGETKLDHDQVFAYLCHIGAEKWYAQNVYDSKHSDSEILSEIMSRTCYRSFGAGLNPNVKTIREGNDVHLANVLSQKHGSVFEHAVVNFMFCDISRVFTHELITHRVGMAKSQESLRYVRLTTLNSHDFAPLIDELTEEEEAWFHSQVQEVFEHLEEVQNRMTVKFDLNNEASFNKKKKLTSRMRRLAPLGLLTNIGWSANFRTLRHLIPLRTSVHAEEEIRMVFSEVGRVCKETYPNIFPDMTWHPDPGISGVGEWRVDHTKV